MSLLLLFRPPAAGGGAIAFDHFGSVTGNSVTTLTVDITTAAVGAVVICWIYNASPETSVTFTGWTQLASADESTASHYSLWWRAKQSGDTTFAPSWPTAQGSSAVWASYTGVNTTAPVEGEADQAISVAGTTQATVSSAPTAANRWAVACYGARSTTATFTYSSADAAQTLRVQTINTANRWACAMLSDSNGTVTAAAHTYTATLSASQSHGADAVLYLIPAALVGPNPPPILVKGQAVAFASTF